MGAALVELQALVQEGRTYIAKEVTKHKNLLDGNMKILEKRLAEVRPYLTLLSAPPTYLSTHLPILLCPSILCRENLVFILYNQP